MAMIFPLSSASATPPIPRHLWFCNTCQRHLVGVVQSVVQQQKVAFRCLLPGYPIGQEILFHRLVLCVVPLVQVTWLALLVALLHFVPRGLTLRRSITRGHEFLPQTRFSWSSSSTLASTSSALWGSTDEISGHHVFFSVS